MKNKIKILIPCLAILFAVAMGISIIVGYFNFIAEKMESDSRSHLIEVYEQVDHSFLSFIDMNWGLLDSCNDYLDLAVRNEDSAADAEQDISAFVARKKAFWGFSGFYFLDEERNFVTPEGERGQLNLSSGWDDVIARREPIMAGDQLAGQNITVFAVPAEHGTFRGFPYSAIAISYTNSDIATALNANAFAGSAKCFILNRKGEVLLSTQVGEGAYVNFLTYLKNSLLQSAGVREEERERIYNEILANFSAMLDDLEKGRTPQTGYLQAPLGVDKQKHCIIYMPVGYEDYFLLSSVPQSAVSEGFLSAQRATLRVMLIIFALVAVAAIACLVFWIVRQLHKNKTELKYRELMFDVLSGTVDDIFIMIDENTQKVDYLSPNVERLLGIKNEEVQNDLRAMAKCAVEYDIVVPKEELEEIPLGGNKHWECEYMHQATGERRWYRVTIYHMNIRDLQKYIIVMSDRTVEQQMNQKLQEALDAAKSANEAKSNFLSNMSHDIRTPMNAIVGFSVLLERSADDPEKVREYTHKIMASSHHLLSLINDVLDMSKIESGKTSLNVSLFDLPDLLEELSIILMPQAKAKEQEFTIHTQGTPPESLMGDRLRLNQILLNLLSNAIKYTPVGGKIEFTVCELQDSAPQFAKLRFIVKDNGIGMSEEFQQEIFKPFSREKNSVINSIQGTGLGMAITKNLVDLMGGIITLVSAPGKGSTFTVELSFALPEENSRQEEWYRQKIARMLVADDEEEICLNIREMMRDTGVDVSYTTSGATALDLAIRAHKHNSDFDVILLDWKMPGMDGVQTARLIREKVGAHIPILVLTSYDWSEIEDEARAAGINAFMPKPFFATTFFQTIKPLFSGAEKPEAPAPAEEGVLNGRRFLVAEDNELNAEILTEMLDIEGARCEVAVNGKIALEMFEKSEPGYYDLILMDVQMPVMNGYEATKAIRNSSHPSAKSIPIIAMTANTFAEDVKSAFDAGMDGHLAKPINMDAVRSTLARFLKKNAQDFEEDDRK